VITIRQPISSIDPYGSSVVLLVPDEPIEPDSRSVLMSRGHSRILQEGGSDTLSL
jgi:hypothetical protein